MPGDNSLIEPLIDLISQSHSPNSSNHICLHESDIPSRKSLGWSLFPYTFNTDMYSHSEVPSQDDFTPNQPDNGITLTDMAVEPEAVANHQVSTDDSLILITFAEAKKEEKIPREERETEPTYVASAIVLTLAIIIFLAIMTGLIR